MAKQATERWMWAALWADGQHEVEILSRGEALSRRQMALGMGGPRRILCGRIPARMTDAAAVDAARRQLNG